MNIDKKYTTISLTIILLLILYIIVKVINYFRIKQNNEHIGRNYSISSIETQEVTPVRFSNIGYHSYQTLFQDDLEYDNKKIPNKSNFIV